MNRFQDNIDEIDYILQKEIEGIKPEKLKKSMEYSLFSGGKRLRGLLLLATCEIFNEVYLPALPFAAAIEAIHTYSLIHDDLPAMDDDDLRRGKPTNHKEFDEATAILAGDALLNLAFEMMLKSVAVGDGREILATSYIARQAGGNKGMISGQMRDLSLENRKITEEELFKTYEEKTGALWRAVFVVGGILGGATEEEVFKLEELGYLLGLSYQIKDDILEETGSEESIGKSVDSDKDNKKQTAISFWGLERAKAEYANMWKRIDEIITEFDTEDSLFIELIESTRTRER